MTRGYSFHVGELYRDRCAVIKSTIGGFKWNIIVEVIQGGMHLLVMDLSSRWMANDATLEIIQEAATLFAESRATQQME